MDSCSLGSFGFSLFLEIVFWFSSTLDFSGSLLLTFPFMFSFAVLTCPSLMFCSTSLNFLTVSSSVVALFVIFEVDFVGGSVLIFLLSCLIAGNFIFL